MHNPSTSVTQDYPQKHPDESVSVSNVSVKYRLYRERPATAKENIIAFIKNGGFAKYEALYALKNVSFSVRRGEVFGIIGSNGAGKSTLLRVITGVLPPTTGSVCCNGKLDSLIQLGAGFDPDLNAVENIYLNGSLHQQTHSEIEKRVPSILEFAELQNFADTPLRYYSSGMYARLGFSVAIDRNPDILIVDEILGVGDERFQQKCDKVFKNYLKQQKTIIMVSHNLPMLKEICSKVAVLSKGQISFIGNPEEAVNHYLDESYKTRLA